MFQILDLDHLRSRTGRERAETGPFPVARRDIHAGNLCFRAPLYPEKDVRSRRTPGPMVELMDAFFI